MASSTKAQNRNKVGTNSKAQLIGGAFRFTIANVSRLVKTTSMPVTIAGAKFRCIASHTNNQLQIAVTAEGNYGTLEAEVIVSILNQKDPDSDITDVKDFTFKKDTALQLPEFAKWDQLFTAGDEDDEGGRGEGGARAKGDEGGDKDGGGTRDKRYDRGDGDDKANRDDGGNNNGGGARAMGDENEKEDVVSAKVNGSGGFVTDNDSMDIVVRIMSVDPRKQDHSAVAKGSAEKGKKMGASTHGGEIVGEGKARNGDAVVASTSGNLKKLTWADNMQATPQNALPIKQKHIASQFTQTEMKVAHQLTQTEMKVASQFTQTAMKVALAHQLTQTEDDGLFSSKIDASTITKAFECQVCFSLFQPPIILCSRGHSFCSGCMRGVPWCPTCEAAFPENARNFALEGIMDYVLYPCSEVACSVMCLLSEREKHKLECKKRKLLCHFYQFQFPCAWNGPLDQYYEHCIESHLEWVIHVTQDKFDNIPYPMKRFDEGITGTTDTRRLDGKIFTIRLFKSNDHFYACVKMFGTQLEAKQFTCEMRLASQDPAIDYKFQTSFQVHCDLEKQHGKCISLSTLDVIEGNGLIDADGDLTIDVRIFKK